MENKDQNGIVGAIIIAGVLIAGAILLKGTPVSAPANPKDNGAPAIATKLAPVGSNDNFLGNSQAKVTLVMYEDFQCPWCGKFDKESEQAIRNSYVKDGKVQLVFRDFPFLGEFVKPYIAAKDESINAAQAARCAGDQSKFWEYHDYLFAHQNGENRGNFAISRLESFANDIGLNPTSFNQCLESGKYAKAITDSKTEGLNAGVQGTPKGFILKNGKTIDTIDGYMPLSEVTKKIDSALK